MPHVDGVRHRFVGANGIVFHVAEAGASDGEPVVLVHGWPQHWYEWRYLIPALAERYRVLALDLRGLGWSDAPDWGYEKEQMATDVLAVLDALGVDRVRLVGHDWGGWIGFLLCLRAPERIERFLALGITHPWQTIGGGWRQLPRFWYQLPVITPGLGYALQRSRVMVRAGLRGGVTDPGAFDEVALASFADRLAEPERARAGVRLYRTFVLREASAVIRGRYMSRRLTVPTRLLVGSADSVISTPLIDGWQEHADAMTAERVPACGHFIAEERPQLVADQALALFA